MARAFLFVLDSFGVGGAPDAAAYGDEGADTLGHIAEFCAAGAGDRAGLRSGPLCLPNMSELGLMHIARAASGQFPAGMPLPEKVYGVYGTANEISRGKDTPSGHWEIAGTPVNFDWGYFPTEGDAFPPELIEALCQDGDVPGISRQLPRIRNRNHRPGSAKSISAPGKPICYTSSDSVFQVAAHEAHFRSRSAARPSATSPRGLLDPYNIGPRHRPAVHRASRLPPSSAPETGATSRCCRRNRHCSTDSSSTAGTCMRSERSAISSPIREFRASSRRQATRR